MAEGAVPARRVRRLVRGRRPGAFEKLLPSDPARDAHTASVYAEFAHRRGWLTLGRALSETEYRAVRDALPGWCAVDREWRDVTAAFGEPSVVFGGQNPHTSKAVAYATEKPEDPMLVVHLWNDHDSGRPQPAVLAARVGGTLLPEAFTFTPLGRSLRASGAGTDGRPSAFPRRSVRVSGPGRRLVVRERAVGGPVRGVRTRWARGRGGGWCSRPPGP
ncbi:hypothetical protein ADK52_28005 [Streptomyces sp. WM6372]|nr:hypothetical protein ADK52_28005 [Streptomyces sp. WM6372]